MCIVWTRQQQGRLRACRRAHGRRRRGGRRSKGANPDVDGLRLDGLTIDTFNPVVMGRKSRRAQGIACPIKEAMRCNTGRLQTCERHASTCALAPCRALQQDTGALERSGVSECVCARRAASCQVAPGHLAPREAAHARKRAAHRPCCRERELR